MTVAMITRSILEVLAVVAIFIGLINEEKLIRWEQKKIRVLRRRMRAHKEYDRKNKPLNGSRVRSNEQLQWMHRPNRSVRTYKGCRIYTLENHAA